MEPKIRKLQILSAIVESYVESGEPVGSKLLAQLLNNTVSSATLRNDMASLSESGYLSQPHTSAGRIPTQRGYRMYVDQLMARHTLPEDIMKQIDFQLSDLSMDPNRFLADAAKMLAGMTGMAAVATTPSSDDARVIGIELMPTGVRTCLLIIMLSPSILKTHMCRIALPLNDENRSGLERVLRISFIGKRLSEINTRSLLSIQEQLGELGKIIEPLLLAMRDTARSGAGVTVNVDGQAHLLERSLFSDETLREMLAFISDSEKLSALLAKHRDTLNVQIGSESGVGALDEASVITARYSSGMGASGCVGVIGPQRMNYSRLIPSVQYFATAVGKVMSAIECEAGTLNGEFFS